MAFTPDPAAGQVWSRRAAVKEEQAVLNARIEELDLPVTPLVEYGIDGAKTRAVRTLVENAEAQKLADAEAQKLADAEAQKLADAAALEQNSGVPEGGVRPEGAPPLENIYGDDGVEVIDQTTGDTIWIDGSLIENRIDTEQTTDIFGKPYLVYSTSDEYPGGRWHNSLDFYSMLFDKNEQPEYVLDPNNPETYIKNPAYTGTITPETPETTTGDADPSKVWNETFSEWQRTSATQNAGSVLSDLLRQWGLSPLLQSTIEEAMIDGISDVGIGQLIRGSDSYKARFPGMAARFTAGLPAISEKDYLDLERDYTALSRQAGFAGVVDRQEMASLIGGDVSAQEFQTRITLAEAAVTDADAETKRLLRLFYDITEEDLVGYYLDPIKSANLFEERRRLEAAGLASTTMDVLGDTPHLGALQRTAEGLADANIQERELQQRLGQRRGAVTSLIGSEGMDSPELAAAEFGLDSESSIRLKRLLEQRRAPFGGQSGMLINEQGASGFGSAR